MINQVDLLQKYDDKQYNFFLLDVRTNLEFSNRHLPGSINIPIDQIETRISEIPHDRHIITICEHGVRSGRVEEYLVKKGFQADSLDGGLSIWTGQTSKL